MMALILMPKDDKLIEFGFGIEKEGKLVLHEFEAAYAAEKGYMKSKKGFFALLSEKGMAEKYLVYRDLRENGYILRLSLSGDFFRVYRKGFRPGEDRTLYLLKVVPEESIKTGNLLADSLIAGKMRKELVYAFVRDGRIIYVSLTRKRFP
jgi:tRNA splicing endonuclease